MADFGSIVQMLEDLKAKVGPGLAPQVEAIEDALGQLQYELPEPAAAAPNIEPPTEPGVEILGGTETTDFPDCCALGDDTEWYCSGTLIAPNVVVTAKHCMQVTRVFLRGGNVANPADAEIVPVAGEFAHPELDLRVLMLAHPAETTPRRIGNASQLSDTAQATLVGFGTIDPDGRYGYGIKRRVDVPVMTFDCTSNRDRKLYGCRPGREIVAGHSGLMLDSCKGDSGGPLYIEKDGEYYLLGATSRGAWGSTTECGGGGIYIRVDLCLDWIREVTGVTIE